MKKLLSLLIITSVLVIGVFGFTSMNHGANRAVGCIASAVDNTPCPENIAAMSVHHIQAFVSFFSVVPSIPFVALLALLLAVFLSTGYLFIKRQDSLLANLTFRESDTIRHVCSPAQGKLLAGFLYLKTALRCIEFLLLFLILKIYANKKV